MTIGLIAPTAFDLLDQGWAFPPSQTGASRVKFAIDADDIRQAIVIILRTAPGERVMLPDFGCRINELAPAAPDITTCNLVEAYVKHALDRWEPRVQVNQVTASFDPQQGCLQISITYLIRARNQIGKLVYPFYLK